MSLYRWFLYDEPAWPTLRVDHLAEWLRERFPSHEVRVRSHLAEGTPADPYRREEALQQWARLWAEAKVFRPDERVEAPSPLSGEIEYERRRLLQRHRPLFGIVYDGEWLQAGLRAFLPPQERRLSDLHILFTGQLLASFDEGDLRYHLRTLIIGFPTLISLTGMVEAPAKPREYYFLRSLRLDDPRVWERPSEKWLVHHDERLTEVAKGFLLQAAFYQWLGEAFCQDSHCRLFNAHWQEELLQAQLGGPYELCPRHRELFKKL